MIVYVLREPFMARVSVARESLLNNGPGKDHAPARRGLSRANCGAQRISVLAWGQLADCLQRLINNPEGLALCFQPPSRRPGSRGVAVCRQVSGDPVGIQATDQV
jgi:hypothetical protein